MCPPANLQIRRFRRILSILIALCKSSFSKSNSTRKNTDPYHPAAASTELSILVAYGGFAIISKVHGVPLTTQTVFSSLALLRISLDPLFLLIQGTPTLVSMFKCLGRIQDLLNDDRQYGLDAGSQGTSSAASLIKVSDGDLGINPFPVYVPNWPLRGSRDFVPPTHVVEIADATFCWKDRDVPALYVLAFSIRPSSFTAIIGP